MHSFKRSGALSGTAPSRAISLSFPFLPKASISFQGAFQKFPCVAKSCKKFPRFGTYQWVTGDLGRKKLPSWALPSGRVQHRPSADLLGRKIRRRSVYYSEQNQGIIQLLLFTRPPAPASRIERARPPSRRRPLRLDPRPAPFPFPSLSFQRLQFISKAPSKNFHAFPKVAKNFRDSGLINGLRATLAEKNFQAADFGAMRRRAGSLTRSPASAAARGFRLVWARLVMSVRLSRLTSSMPSSLASPAPG